MRQGFRARLILTPSGEIAALATGADHVTEHECGSAEMQARLASPPVDDQTLIKALKAGVAIQYPSVFERKRITRATDDRLKFVSFGGKMPQAILGWVKGDLAQFKHELSFREIRGEDPDVAGAWDESSFAIRVRGAPYIAALTAFWKAMKEGHCLFAGTFIEVDPSDNTRLTGVVLADERHLTESSNAAIVRAQADYESNLRLKARDDTRQLSIEMAAASGKSSPGHFWVRWLDGKESALAYCLNPGAYCTADYGGPYNRKQLLDWATSKYSYPLKIEKATA